MTLQPGTYRARPMPEYIGTDKASTGTEFIYVRFSLLDENYPGENIEWRGWLSDAAFPNTLKALRACGFTGTDMTDFSSIDGNTSVDLVIENETYDGKTFPRVKWVNAVGGSPALRAPMPENEKKAFRARMAAKIAAVEGAGAATKAKKKPAPAPETSSDVPF